MFSKSQIANYYAIDFTVKLINFRIKHIYNNNNTVFRKQSTTYYFIVPPSFDCLSIKFRMIFKNP